MYFLSFETSTKIFSLALNKDGKVLRHRNLKSALLLEDCILPAVDKMLDSAGIKFGQIDGFAIALGPGSFTSLRVGLATVKAFAMGTCKPVVGIPTLDIVAHGVDRKDCDEICVLSDARREKVYACLYGPSPQGTLVPKSGYLLTSLDDVLEKVHGRTLFVGDAVGLYRVSIKKAFEAYCVKIRGQRPLHTCQCLFADEKFWYPQAKVMAALAYERFRHKKHDNAADLQPLYLYSQDCQVSSTHGR